METTLISIYTEHSPTGHPFKTRQDYRIDWNHMVKISEQCGMLSVKENTFSDIAMRYTLWSRHTSYNEWLAHEYVQYYLSQRDSYNLNNGIVSNLSFIYL